METELRACYKTGEVTRHGSVTDMQVSAWPSTRPIQLIVTPLIFFFSVLLSRWDFLLTPSPPPRAVPLNEMWPRLAAISNMSQTSALLRPPRSYPQLLQAW